VEKKRTGTKQFIHKKIYTKFNFYISMVSAAGIAQSVQWLVYEPEDRNMCLIPNTTRGYLLRYLMTGCATFSVSCPVSTSPAVGHSVLSSEYQFSCGAYSVSHPGSTRGTLPEGKATWAWIWHPSPSNAKAKTQSSNTFPLPHVFAMGCWIKHRGIFTFSSFKTKLIFLLHKDGCFKFCLEGHDLLSS
jgi:hypothetical protein